MHLSKAHFLLHTVSKADIVDWRTRTIACRQKLDGDTRTRTSPAVRQQARKTLQNLHPIGPPSNDEQKDAEEALTAIYDRALKIAILFRSSKTVSYSWLQKEESLSRVERTEESDIIGIAADPGRVIAEQCTSWRIVFGGVVKNENSEGGDRVVLRKSELVVG